MKPPFDFAKVVEEELLRGDASIFSEIGSDIEEALTKDQHPGLRISDVGGCSLAIWAKCHGELTLPKSPQDQWSRLMAGTLFGALIARVFLAAMERRAVECELEVRVELDEIPGHLDIVLPTYQHIYEIKSNYNLARKPPSLSNWLQAAMYVEAYCDDYTTSIIMLQPAIPGAQPRLIEYDPDDMDWLRSEAKQESFRLRRAAGAITPPEPDVLPEEKWRCNSCQMGSCAKNRNPMRGLVAA
jgi:hypothetical protein